MNFRSQAENPISAGLHSAATREYPKAKILAGGTDLVVEVNQRHTRWPTLISVEGVEALQRPEAVEATEWVLAAADERLKRGNHALVGAQDDQLLRLITPPAVGMGEVGDELRRCFVEHLRLRPGRRFAPGFRPDADGFPAPGCGAMGCRIRSG